MTKSRQQVPSVDDIAVGFGELGTSVGKALSVIAGLSIVAFAIGWVHWRSYFAAFDWPWLVAEVRTSELLVGALVPVGILFYCVVISASDAARSRDWFAQSRKEVAFFLLVAGVLAFVASILEAKLRYSMAETLRFGAYVPLGYVAANLAVDLVFSSVTRAQKHWTWRLLTFGLLCGAVFYYLPHETGRTAALRDLAKPDRLAGIELAGSDESRI